MGYIAFNDGAAANVISSSPAPMTRFLGWKPKNNPVGPRHHALGTGIPYKIKLRDEQLASFSIVAIARVDLDIPLRFQQHAEQGGVFTVYTEDTSARVYTCYLAEGSTVSIDGPDENYEYSLSLTVMNNAQTTLMICNY